MKDVIYLKTKCPNCEKIEMRKCETSDLGQYDIMYKKYEYTGKNFTGYISGTAICDNCSPKENKTKYGDYYYKFDVSILLINGYVIGAPDNYVDSEDD